MNNQRYPITIKETIKIPYKKQFFNDPQEILVIPKCSITPWIENNNSIK